MSGEIRKAPRNRGFFYGAVLDNGRNLGLLHEEEQTELAEAGAPD
jgi:hypothetical protein